jgi:outer membrane biosynthesis protein TonB
VIVSFSRFIYSLILVIGITLNSGLVLALELKGAAIYQELGKDYYIASLYLADTSKDALEVLDRDEAQQMKIKVIAKRWSARKWKAQWQNNIAINNAVDTDPKLAEAIASFTEFPLHSLRAGDEVLVDYVPNIGTRIFFNTHQVVITRDIKLYSYLLNTWLGKFSPNRIFREQIAGSTIPDSEMLLRVDEAVSNKRIAEVGTWFVSEEEKRKAKKQQELLIAEELKKRKQDEINKEKALAKKKADEEAKERKRLLAQQKQAEELKRKQQSSAISLEKQKQNKDEEYRKRLSEKKLAEKKLADQKKDQSLQYEMNMQDYYQQLYLWQLQSKINESVTYPPWAKQFSEQGPVELTFATDRSANLLNVINKTPDTSKILVQEVERRLKLALEAMPRPPALKGERWSFTVRYLFDPSIKELAPLPKPKKP